MGFVLIIEAAFMLPSACISLYLKEYKSLYAFLLTISVMLLFSLPLVWKRPEKSVLYMKEGLQIAAVSWLTLSFFGALPFFISGEIPSFLNALFESVSGFTTTGASILNEIESLPRGILFWRSFTHWIGGMGVLVFVLSIISLAGGYSLNIMRAESPGPSTRKFVPKIKDTAKILYGIYIALTLLEILFLSLGGMTLFDSLVHSFGTAGTGGFSVKNASIGAYNNAYYDYVISIFMILFGVNFNAYFLILIRKFKELFRFEELRVYLFIILAAVLMVTLSTYKTVYPTLLNAFRYSLFQVSSIMTTTGYTTANFDQWPQFSRMILLALMFIGASAGSTGGGIKVSRVVIAYKTVKREIKRILHPHAYDIVRLDGKSVSEETISGINVFLILYTAIFTVSLFILSLDGNDFDATFSAVAACLNNIGPGLDIVGPIGNYDHFSAVSKIVLSLDMLLGRLEIFPLLVLLFPGIRRRKGKIGI